MLALAISVNLPNDLTRELYIHLWIPSISMEHNHVYSIDWVLGLCQGMKQAQVCLMEPGISPILPLRMLEPREWRAFSEFTQ